MAITRTYTYVGELKGAGQPPYNVYEGVYAFEAADLYDRDARPALVFAGLTAVVGMMGVIGFAFAASNLGYPAVPLPPSGRTVTFIVLESGTAAAGLDEKTDNEAYGVDGAIRCTVFGI